MRLEPGFTDDTLASLGENAVELLRRGEIGTLANRYGYALRCDRDAETAIRRDLARCLDEVGASTLKQEPSRAVRAVKHFQPSNSSLVAVVECEAPAMNEAVLLVELIVTRSGSEHHLTLEEISAVG